MGLGCPLSGISGQEFLGELGADITFAAYNAADRVEFHRQRPGVVQSADSQRVNRRQVAFEGLAEADAATAMAIRSFSRPFLLIFLFIFYLSIPFPSG